MLRAATHAEVFDFEEFLDAVFRAPVNPRWADAAFVHAAEGGDLGRDDAFVDADDAVFERLGDASDVVISRHRHPKLSHMGPGGVADVYVRIVSPATL